MSSGIKKSQKKCDLLGYLIKIKIIGVTIEDLQEVS